MTEQLLTGTERIKPNQSDITYTFQSGLYLDQTCIDYKGLGFVKILIKVILILAVSTFDPQNLLASYPINLANQKIQIIWPAHEIMIYLTHLYKVTLLRPMEFSINFDTVKSGWSIVYIEGLQVIIFTLKIDFVLANSAEPDEMPPYMAFHLSLRHSIHLFISGFWSSKG